jgi:hypothetical protein
VLSIVLGRRDGLTHDQAPRDCRLAAGALLSIRAQKRIEEVNGKVQRIVAGELRERLPIKGVNDPFDRLAVAVNGMRRDRGPAAERAGTGDDIAHDLRSRSPASGSRLSVAGRMPQALRNCACPLIRRSSVSISR